jgi:hypothetical protein
MGEKIFSKILKDDDPKIESESLIDNVYTAESSGVAIDVPNALYADKESFKNALDSFYGEFGTAMKNLA